MEYTHDLTIFENIIIAAANVISVSEIVRKAGNERKIDYLHNRTDFFIKEVGYLEDGEYKKDVYNNLRQLFIFVILNSDLPVINEIKEYPNLELLMGSLPTLPKYVMCEILWHFDIDEIIGEILVHCHPTLTVDVAKSLLENFKYFLPDNCLQKLHMLTVSCYKLIYNMMFYKLDCDIFNSAYDNFLLCLKYFLEPPNSKVLDTISEDDLFIYMGKRIYAFLCALNECFNVFTNNESQILQSNHVYISTMPPDVITKEGVSLRDADKDNDIHIIKESLLKCNTALLDACQTLLSDVSIDIFCSWTEIEENGICLQNKIGDLSYRIKTNIHQFIKDNETVRLMLDSISIEPRNIEDEINKVDVKTIENKICEDSSDSIKWLKALVHRESLCTEDILLREIYNRSNTLDSDENKQLFNVFYDQLKNPEVNREFLKSLAIKCFENCTHDIKQELVEKHFCDDIFNDTLTVEMFDSMMTTIFNKLISSPEEADLSQIYDVFIQSPKKVYIKIFLLAAENYQQTSIMVKAMILLSKYSNFKYHCENESCVLLVAKETIDNHFDTDIKSDNFIMFIDELRSNKVLSESKLLHMIIMPSIHIGLKTNNVEKLYLHCKMLQKAYKPTENEHYRAPMLIILAQVLDIVRWRINTFTAKGPNVLKLALELVSSILTTYNSNIPETDREWMKMKLKNMNPLNMYYYRCLWEPPGDSFVDIISGQHIDKEINHERIVLWLSQQLCSANLQEWNKMWDSLEMFETVKIVDLFHTAVMIIVVTEKNNRTEQTEACLLYCLKNYISCIKNKYLQPPLYDAQVLNIATKLAALENLVEVSDIKEINTILLPIFSFIAERSRDYSVDMCSCLHNKLKNRLIQNACANFFVKTKSNEK